MLSHLYYSDSCYIICVVFYFFRYGFNSEGHDAVLSRVKTARKDGGVVGVNLGKNKESNDPVGDYAKGIELFSPHADYLVINISR